MGEEITSKNGRISDIEGLVTLTLDRVILHTVMHQSSTSTYIPNFIKIEETFCGRTDGRTDVRTYGHLRHTSLGRLLCNGNGADPGVQAVSPQVTISHSPSSRLPLLSARPAVTFPAAEASPSHCITDRKAEHPKF